MFYVYIYNLLSYDRLLSVSVGFASSGVWGAVLPDRGAGAQGRRAVSLTVARRETWG